MTVNYNAVGVVLSLIIILAIVVWAFLNRKKQKMTDAPDNGGPLNDSEPYRKV